MCSVGAPPSSTRTTSPTATLTTSLTSTQTSTPTSTPTTTARPLKGAFTCVEASGSVFLAGTEVGDEVQYLNNLLTKCVFWSKGVFELALSNNKYLVEYKKTSGENCAALATDINELLKVAFGTAGDVKCVLNRLFIDTTDCDKMAARLTSVVKAFVVGDFNKCAPKTTTARPTTTVAATTTTIKATTTDTVATTTTAKGVLL